MCPLSHLLTPLPHLSPLAVTSDFGYWTYTLYGNSQKATWRNAEAVCATNGGQLASFASSAEANYVFTTVLAGQFPTVPTNAPLDDTYITDVSAHTRA